MLLIIDNYDSFTFNLFDYFKFFIKVNVIKNKNINLKKIKNIKPNYLVISPGPGSPKNCGFDLNIIKEFYKKIPILGVCLGHQCIGHFFGAKVEKMRKVYHGKVSKIFHKKRGLFKNIPSPFCGTRYHSLIVKKDNFPSELKVDAYTKEGQIMAISHNFYPIYGVQFHPESFLTKFGKKIIKNFIFINN